MITDEMANEALGATEFARNKATREWMRAALTAALPLIRGAVVEECAKVAMAHVTYPDFSDNPAYARFEPAEIMAKKIACAIRALSPREAGE